MKKLNNKFAIISLSILLALGACKDLDELNINPNAPAPESTDLNLLLPTVLTGLGNNIVSLGFGDLAGVMQHTQKTGWSSGHNDYDWNNPGQSWAGYYGVLRNVQEFYNKAEQDGYEFHLGVGLILKAYTFGLIADLWGDAPYSEALQAEKGADYFTPVFDPQQNIYHSILSDLETANTLLSKDVSEYTNIPTAQDVMYGGNILKWRKLANSLALRYYMRLQAKEPSFAQTGINTIASNPASYPIITGAADDANVGYPGTNANTSWPSTMVFNPADVSSEYLRRKPCATLVDAMQALNDPRLGVWFEKVEIPLVRVDTTANEDDGDLIIDRIVNGKREISYARDTSFLGPWWRQGEPDLSLDYDQEYVGIPVQTYSAQAYNLTPNLVTQGAYNPHTSQLNLMYAESTGDLLQMRFISAAEVNFILAEAALYGWVSGTPEEYYQDGVRESFVAWRVESEYDSYLAGASYSGLESIITQKWIASWTAAAESWFDYRRTGLPDLQTGVSARREKLPLRFYYSINEDISTNEDNAVAAIEQLEPTTYLGTDVTKNSAWSKFWLLKDTGLPY